MSSFGAVELYSRTDDWAVVAGALCLFFVVLYPLYMLFLRRRRTMRIKRQLVTTPYKLPMSLSPVDVAYLFSARVSKRQVYATLLDLANQGVILVDRHGQKLSIEPGPKVHNDLRVYEKLLLSFCKPSDGPLDYGRMLEGDARFKPKKASVIAGTRSYVFWALVRYSLQSRNVIKANMKPVYGKMLLKFAVVAGLAVSIAPIVIIRFAQMSSSGEIIFSQFAMSIANALLLWVLCMPILIIASFFLLRFRAIMIGRSWLMTKESEQYLMQYANFREFVRLIMKDRVRFESPQLKEECLRASRSYAIAFGFVKPDL